MTAPAGALRDLAETRLGRLLLCAYAGPSMYPTLRPDDLVQVEATCGSPVRAGDVVLFVPADADRAVVHRVIETTDAGVRTQGDNNLAADPWLLQPDRIIGRVTAAQRGSRRRAVHGGCRGLVVARWVRIRRSTASAAGHVLGPLYWFLVRARVAPRLIPDTFRPRVVQFSSSGRQRLRLTLGQRPIGFFDVEARVWRIERWYRLLVDERSLPIHQ